MKWFSLLSVVFLMLATLLCANPVAYADDPPAGECNIVIDICVTETSQVHVTASDGSHLDVGAQQSTTDAHLHFAADADTVFDIYITGDGETDIDVSGPCQVNLRVEGPSEVHIDAGDEVRLNVEASEESQVFVDDETLDNPTQKPDEPTGYQESGEVDEHSSRSDSRLAIVSGAFPVVGVLAFFLIRRRAKRNKTKETTE